MPKRELIIDPSLYDINKPVGTLDDIRKLNRHRYEMELLSGVLYEDSENRAGVGYLKTTAEDFWVRGHLPGFPLMPGVIMCEAAAQLTAYFAAKFELMKDCLLGLAALDDIKFRGVVNPGDVLVIQTRMLFAKKMLISAEFIELVGDNVVCEGIVKGIPLPKQ